MTQNSFLVEEAIFFLLENFNGLVIHNLLPGITVKEEDVKVSLVDQSRWRCCVARDLVLFSIGKNWGGIENLFFIPARPYLAK